MLDKLAWFLLENASDASIIVYLLATLIAGAYAFGRGHLVLGSTYHKTETAYDTLKDASDQLSTDMTEQRILNAVADTTVKHLTSEVQRLQLDLADCRGQRREGR